MVEVMRIKNSFDCLDKLLSLLCHHHFEFHLGVPNYVAYLVFVHRPQLVVFLEEILCSVVLTSRAAQPVCISFARQVAKLRLLGHLQMSRTLDGGNALGVLGARITLLKRRD